MRLVVQLQLGLVAELSLTNFAHKNVNFDPQVTGEVDLQVGVMLELSPAENTPETQTSVDWRD